MYFLEYWKQSPIVSPLFTSTSPSHVTTNGTAFLAVGIFVAFVVPLPS